MFTLLIVLGIILLVACAVLGVCGAGEDSTYLKTVSVVTGILCGVVFSIAFFGTARGDLITKKLSAESTKGAWLIVDNSGGKTMRHWVLKKGYVKESSESDGWEFYDKYGNLCYVSGDAFVMRVNEPFEQFMANYRARFNIPPEDPALE